MSGFDPNASKLRWGLLGTSFISHTVADAINASPNSTISAVFGRDEMRLSSFALKFNIPRIYTRAEKLLDDNSVNVVYIGLPSHLHAQMTTEAAKRGKPILSEKSLATTMQDSEAMIAAVERSQVFFLEGLMYLCHPVMENLGEIIRSGKLGNVRSIEGHYAANIWRVANPLGMGTLYNLACYPVSLLHFVMESAFGREAFKTRQVSGTGNLSSERTVHVRDAALLVRFDNGVLGTLQSTDSFGSDFGFTVLGDRAVLRFKTNPWLPQKGENVMEIKVFKGETETVVVNGEYDAFGYQVRRVEDCLSQGMKQAERPSPSWQDSIDIMELLTEWEADVKQRHKIL